MYILLKQKYFFSGIILLSLIISCTLEAKLYYAIKEGNIEKVKLAIDKGADINEKRQNNQTCLMYAVQCSNLEITALLIEKGASVNERDDFHKTVLDYSDDCTPDSIKKEIKIILSKAKAVSGLTLIRAIQSKNIVRVRNSIKSGEKVNDRYAEGETPLHYAARESTPEIAVYLIKMGAVVNTLNDSRCTPYDIAEDERMRETLAEFGGAKKHDLIESIDREDIEKLKSLIKSGMPVNGEFWIDNDATTPLIHASKLGNTEIIKILLDASADINESDRDFETPLMTACYYGNFDAVRLLVEYKSNVNEKTPSWGISFAIIPLPMGRDSKSALMFACSNSEKEEERYKIVKFLVEHKAKINEQSSLYGNTPLMLACDYKLGTVVKYLLEKGADVNIANRDGETALSTSCEPPNNIEIIKLLLDYGSSINIKLVNGNTPLMYVMNTGNPDVEVVKLLVNKGADINAKNHFKETPLYLSVNYEPDYNEGAEAQAEVLKFLAERGANINVKNSVEGMTPLMLACKNDNFPAVKYLLSKRASINTRDNDKETALVHAMLGVAKHYISEIATLLLEHGADVNVRETYFNDSTVLMLACKEDDPELVKLMLKKGARVNDRDKWNDTALSYAIDNDNEEIIEIIRKAGGIE